MDDFALVDQAIERRIELTQLRAGEVLTEENVGEIQAMFDELEATTDEINDAYQRGLAVGRKEAAGVSVEGLLRQIDELKQKVWVEKSLQAFYRKLMVKPAKES